MKVFRMAAVLAVLVAPAYAQTMPNINLMDSGPGKSEEEKAAERERDARYKETLKKIRMPRRPTIPGAACAPIRPRPPLRPRIRGPILAPIRGPAPRLRPRSRKPARPPTEPPLRTPARLQSPYMIGVVVVGSCDMTSRPRDIADRMARRRDAGDGFLRQRFKLPRLAARAEARAFFARYPEGRLHERGRELARTPWRRDRIHDAAPAERRLGTADSLAAAAQAIFLPMAFSSRSIRNCTRRTARRSILVSVLPVLTLSPILNCHCQMPGIAVFATVNSMPL